MTGSIEISVGTNLALPCESYYEERERAHHCAVNNEGAQG